MTPAQRRSIAPWPRVLCLCRRGGCAGRRAVLADRRLCRQQLRVAHAPASAADARRRAADGDVEHASRGTVRAADGAPAMDRAPGQPHARASGRAHRTAWRRSSRRPLFALGLWLWHAPHLYEDALANEQLHTLEHLTFLITAAVFWRMISTSGDRRLDAGTAILLVTLVGLQGNLLAALITLAPDPLYLELCVATACRSADCRPADVGPGGPDLSRRRSSRSRALSPMFRTIRHASRARRNDADAT